MKSVKVSVLAMLLAWPILAHQGGREATQWLPGLLSEKAAQGVNVAFTKYRIEDLPAAVQKTVGERSGGLPIADIVREERNGQTVWEVQFDREGRNPRILVANDGTLLAEKQPGPDDKFTPG